MSQYTSTTCPKAKGNLHSHSHFQALYQSSSSRQNLPANMYSNLQKKLFSLAELSRNLEKSKGGQRGRVRSTLSLNIWARLLTFQISVANSSNLKYFSRNWMQCNKLVRFWSTYSKFFFDSDEIALIFFYRLYCLFLYVHKYLPFSRLIYKSSWQHWKFSKQTQSKQSSRQRWQPLKEDYFSY